MACRQHSLSAGRSKMKFSQSRTCQGEAQRVFVSWGLAWQDIWVANHPLASVQQLRATGPGAPGKGWRRPPWEPSSRRAPPSGLPCPPQLAGPHLSAVLKGKAAHLRISVVLVPVQRA